MPVAIHRFWCVLFVCWLVIPVAFADDFGLANPAANEFGEYKSDVRNTGNIARKSPAFQDRTFPAQNQTTHSKSVQKSEPIRQVSATNESNDPFQMVTQPSVPQPASLDWEAGVPSVPATPNTPLLLQNNVIPYNPNGAAGFGNPYPGMQGIPMNFGGAGIGYAPQFAQSQFAPSQFTQPQFAPFAPPMEGGGVYPQQYMQQYMQQLAMSGMSPSINPYALAANGLTEFSQFTPSFADPSGMYQMNYQPDYQESPDYQTLYQALLHQARLQGEGVPENGASNGKKQNADEAKKQADANWTFNNLIPVRVSSPLCDTLFACAKTVNPFCTPAGPDKGVGMPLVGTSWLDHPWYAGGFVGGISGSDLVSNMIKQKRGGTGGLICGYNFNDYWGLESRLNFSAIDIYDTAYAKGVFDEISQGDVVLLPTTRTNNLTVLDASVHYYPLGNAKWRPFFKYGLGFGRQQFVNIFGNKLSADIVAMPMGVGVRYWWNERIALQADLVDNVIFASRIAKTQNNVAFTVGLTYAFGNGGRIAPVHYWPATPSMGSKW